MTVRRRINLLLLGCKFLGASLHAQEIRVGLIGLDTSHATAFTEILNDPKHPEHIPGARVVAGFPGGSPDIPSSIDRVPQYSATLKDKWGVEIVPTIAELVSRVDAVLLTSVDGRPHREQIRPVIAAHNPVCRFYPTITGRKGASGEIVSVDAFSPAPLEPHHPDLYWYGIHGVEILFTLMGPGCAWVERHFTDDQELTVAGWKDGRIATFRGMRVRDDHGYGATVHTLKGTRLSEPVKGALYKQLVLEIVKFFQTGKPPVSNAETLEILAFMDAAQLSRERGGARVPLN